MTQQSLLFDIIFFWELKFRFSKCRDKENFVPIFFFKKVSPFIYDESHLMKFYLDSLVKRLTSAVRQQRPWNSMWSVRYIYQRERGKGTVFVSNTPNLGALNLYMYTFSSKNTPLKTLKDLKYTLKVSIRNVWYITRIQKYDLPAKDTWLVKSLAKRKKARNFHSIQNVQASDVFIGGGMSNYTLFYKHQWHSSQHENI